MKIKKKMIIAAIFLLIMAGTFLILRGVMKSHVDLKTVKVQREDDVSRFQWMEMLCKKIGITDYENATPYFADVDKENTYFSYVQAAVEWELVQQEKNFSGEGYASGNFIVYTAMKSIGERRIQLYLDAQDTISDEDYVTLAVECGLIEKKDLMRSYSVTECEELLARLQDLYYGDLWKDNYVQAVYQKNVTELQTGDVINVKNNALEITVTESVRENLSIGSILVFESDCSGLKTARKVTGIDAATNVLQLEEVSIDEVLESLICSDVVQVTFEDICASYELTAENEISRSDISNAHGVWQSVTFSKQLERKGFKILLETKKEGKDNYLYVNVTDNETNISYQLPIKKKVSDATNFTGEVDVDRINVGAIIDYDKRDKVKYAELALDTHTNVKAGIKGEISSEDDGERIPLYKTQAPVGNGLLGVDIQVYLVISVQGEISFEAEIPVQASVCYEKGKGLRNFELKPAFKEPRLQVNCEADFLIRTEPTLVLLMCVDVFDVEVDAGAAIDAEMVLRANQQLCVDVSASYPVLCISVCGDEKADTILGKLGLSAEWELISKENAPIKIGMHYEKLSDGTSQFVDQCTYVEGKTDLPAKSMSPEISSAAIGEYVTFGHYEQDGNTANGAEPIEWQVLAKEEGRTLLISRYALDCKSYHEVSEEITWENCTLRKWLNDSFYSSAFDASEQGRIVEVTNDNPDSYVLRNELVHVGGTRWAQYGATGGNATSDHVFLLSYEEALDYFASDEDRATAPTAYASDQGVWFSDGVHIWFWWWLRSPGSYLDEALGVYDNGEVSDFSVYSGIEGVDEGAVRPALWVMDSFYGD